MCQNNPICDFAKTKKALLSKGYTIGEAQPYIPLKVADVNLNNIQNGELEIADDGIFYVNPQTGSRHQVFLYKRRYYMSRYGTRPKYHIRYCSTLQEHSQDEYRRANTGTVPVWDPDMREDVMVSGLELCKNCLSIIRKEGLLGYGSDMTSDEFEEILRAANDNQDVAPEDTDMKGYLWKWPKISEAYRTKKGFKCERCGYTAQSRMERGNIHVHHKNGNKAVNDESNLECLCIACHANVDDHHKENYSKGANKVLLDAFRKEHPEAGPHS